MDRQRCLQCRRRFAVKRLEVTISDGNTTYWHYPRICFQCAMTLSATLEAHELTPEQPGLMDAVQHDGLVAR